MRTVAQLKPGERGVVESFSSDEYSSKFMEMGILPGSEVELKFIAPFGDPMCIQVGPASISIRKKEASTIALSH